MDNCEESCESCKIIVASLWCGRRHDYVSGSEVRLCFVRLFVHSFVRSFVVATF